MMDERTRNVINKIFEKLYYYLALSLVFVITFVGGLGIFSFVGSNILSYTIYNKLAKERYKEKVRVFKMFKEGAVKSVVDNAKLSLILVAFIFILGVDLFYFSTSITPLYTGLFYLSIILIYIVINSVLLSFYIRVVYPSLSYKENIQNSISIILVNIVDVLVLDIAMLIIVYILAKISFILVLILTPGIWIELSYKYYTRMIENKSITNLIFSIS